MIDFRKFVAGIFVIAVTLTPISTLAAKPINFLFTDVNNKVLRLSDYKGKWLLINFWAPWCPSCGTEIPALGKLNTRKDFAVIGIAMDYDSPQVIYTYMSRHNMTYPQVLGGNHQNLSITSPGNQVGPVEFFPISYLYDPKGELVMYIPGQVDQAKLISFTNTYRY